MDAQLLWILGMVVGCGSFFGLFAYSGKISGKWAAIRQKRITKKTIDALKSDEMKAFALESSRKANELFTSEQGYIKFNWMVDKIVNAIPGKTDDDAIRQWAQAFYDEYKEEINK